MLSRFFLSLIDKLHVVEKLAESRPFRRAAQITAYAIIKAQLAGRDASQRALRSQTLRQIREEAGRVTGDLGAVGSGLKRVQQTFANEVKEGWKRGARQIKK